MLGHCRLGEAGRVRTADEALDGLGHAGFADAVRQRFHVDCPVDADLSLVEALWRLEPRLVLTTNYDEVLRWANPDATAVANSQRAELSELFTLVEFLRKRVFFTPFCMHWRIDDD